MKNNDYIVVSFSGGKDSTAMLLRLMELGEHIDEVVCCDTYKEFPAMYRHIEKVKKIVENAGIKFTILKSEKSFDYYMFEHNSKKRAEYKQEFLGFSWPGPRRRWCTSRLKIDVVNKYFKELTEKYNVIRYIGIAYDEQYRLERTHNKQQGHRHPLAEWRWSEEQCLKYCYSRGFDWENLYEIFRKKEGRCPRVSCWCCPLQPLEDLRVLRKNFPDLWAELIDMDKRAWLRFRADYTVEQLEIRFAFEEERQAKGLSITTREFHRELRNILRKGADDENCL